MEVIVVAESINEIPAQILPNPYDLLL